jgi:hypothetical protein
MVQQAVGAPVNNNFGYNTRVSVIAFQKKHGLVADGIVGHQPALAIAGKFREARAATPGALTHADRSGMHRREATKVARRRARARSGGASGGSGLYAERRTGGGVLAENVVDKLGNIHDLLGKFAPKLGGGHGSPASVIPEYDPRGLKFGKGAGGSNGARWATAPDGRRWLVKTYKGNEDRVATELLANAVYREMGARVPRAGRIRLHNGKSALAYPALEGKPDPHVFQRRGARPSAEVGRHYMTDALLANWDVAGLEDDNILWGPDGAPFRVDQGGTLEFRAQGARKDFGPIPHEVTTMLQPGGQGRRSSFVTAKGLRSQAAEISRTLTPERIDALVRAAGFRDRKMADRVRRNLRLRVHWMGEFAAGRTGLPVPPSQPVKEGVELMLLEAFSTFGWDPNLHPRDFHGKFAKKLFGLQAGHGVQLDAKTRVSKAKDGSFRVTRSGAITKFKRPADAARAALDRSVKGKDADSIGGGVSHKDWDAFLKAQGIDPEEPGKFGGGEMSQAQLSDEVAALADHVAIAKAGDQYEKKALPTLEARLANAKAKLKKEGASTAAPGKPDVASAVAKAHDVEPPKGPSGSGVLGVAATLKGLEPGKVHQHPGGGSVMKKKDGSFAVALPPAEGGAHPTGGAYPDAVSAAQALIAGHHSADAGDVFGGGKTTKAIKGPQAVPSATGSIGGVPYTAIHALDLAAGDVVQKKKGGHKYELIEPKGPAGAWLVKGPDGKQKTWPSYAKVGLVTKADGSELKLKAPGAASPAAVAEKTPQAGKPWTQAQKDSWAQLVETKLEAGTGKWKDMSALKDGAVFQTPAGQIGILKKSEPAYSGYLTAYDVKTGQKFEPHATNYAPFKASEDPDVIKGAQTLLDESLKHPGGASGAAGAPTSTQSHSGTSVHPSWTGYLHGKAAEDHLTQQQPSLGPAQKAAMKGYTNGAYDTINGGLRQGTLSPKMLDNVMALDQAYHDAPPLDVDIVTHRGAQLSDFFGTLAEGHVIQDLGYMSTSPTKPWDSKPVVLHMRLRAGTKNVLWVDNFSTHTGEREAVVKRGAIMKVVQVAESGGKKHVYVDVMG